MAIYKNEKQLTFNRLWIDNNWVELKTFLQTWLEEEPDDHWIVLQIAETNYQLKNNAEALKYAEKAFNLAPVCPLAIWEYAETLVINGKNDAAARLYKILIRKGVNRIAFGECGEGIRTAKGMVNDSIYVLGLIYAKKGEFKLAEKYVRRYISNRNKKYVSRFNLREVKKDLGKILQGIAPEFTD
jgi:tetratricopeptide (TPR) repeat protein